MKRTIQLLALLAVTAAFGTGCKSADIAQIKSMGSRHHITLYGCDGRIIGQWDSPGNVSNEAQSDGWYFQDEKTGKLVEITSTIVIEQE